MFVGTSTVGVRLRLGFSCVQFGDFGNLTYLFVGESPALPSCVATYAFVNILRATNTEGIC